MLWLQQLTYTHKSERSRPLGRRGAHADPPAPQSWAHGRYRCRYRSRSRYCLSPAAGLLPRPPSLLLQPLHARRSPCWEHSKHT